MLPAGWQDSSDATYAKGSRPAPGEPFAVIAIPAINVEWAVVDGTEPEHLRLGPGLMGHAALPGEVGNSVIAGHRTTWGAPFNRVDELAPGDRIMVESPTGTHVYEVTSQFVVAPEDFWVAEHREGAWLTLTACHPKGSARQRIVTVAKLVDGPNAAFVTEAFGDVADPRAGEDV